MLYRYSINSKVYSDSLLPVKGLVWVRAFFFIIIILSIGQDFVSSTMKGGAFYLSESALYKMNWILFLPISGMIFFFRQKIVPCFAPTVPLLITIPVIPVVSLLHILLASSLIHLLSNLLLDHTYAVMQVFRYFFAEEFYLTVLVYLLAYFGLQIGQKNKTENQVFKPAHTLDISTRSGITRVPIESITHISTERPYIAIHTINRRYLENTTLTNITNQLDPSIFIRIHRSAIVNLHFVQNIKSRGNGDYDLQLSNGLSLRLSRHYASSFRSFF